MPVRTKIASRDIKHSSYSAVLRHVCRKLHPRQVLEWGPGLSTAIIAKECPQASILSIEHSPKYAESAVAICPSAEIKCLEISMSGGASQGYVNYPLMAAIENGKIDNRYDLIFIDGRFRNDCLVAARLLVSKGGVVILHDSHRDNYHPATLLFSHRQDFPGRRTMAMSLSPLSSLDGLSSDPVPCTALDSKSTLDLLQSRLVSGKPFSYVRFGDADLLFLDDPSYKGNRRHAKTKGLAEGLSEAFTIDHPDYLVGCVAGGHTFGNIDYECKLDSIAGKWHEGKEYLSAVSLHTAYTLDPDRFVEFCKESFSDKRVLLIGGESICKSNLVRKAFNVLGVIGFPDINAYRSLDAEMGRIEKNVPKYDVMIVALGQATRVLASRLWRKGLRDIQYFDVGSTVDAMAGLSTRSWIAKCPEMVAKYEGRFCQ